MDMYLIKRSNKDNNLGLLMVSEKGRILVCNMHKEVEAKREILNDERNFEEISNVQKLKEFMHNKRIEAVQIIYRSHTELSFAYKILFEYKDVDFGNIIINNLTFSSDTRDAIEEPDVYPYRRIELGEAVDSRAMTPVSYITTLKNCIDTQSLNIIAYVNKISPAYSLIGTLYASLFKAAEILGYTTERVAVTIRETMDNLNHIHSFKFIAVTGSKIADKNDITYINIYMVEDIISVIKEKTEQLSQDENFSDYDKILEIECELFKSIIVELLENRIYLTVYTPSYNQYTTYNVSKLNVAITDNKELSEMALAKKYNYILKSNLSNANFRYIVSEITKA